MVESFIRLSKASTFPAIYLISMYLLTNGYRPLLADTSFGPVRVLSIGSGIIDNSVSSSGWSAAPNTGSIRRRRHAYPQKSKGHLHMLDARHTK